MINNCYNGWVFIDKPIGRVRDFVSGLFGPRNSKDKEISERTISVNDNSNFEIHCAS